MEKFEDTFDSLLEDDELDMDELKSALFQIIITLLCYQKAFKMTHNDLHTHNIMYNKTDKQYLYYKYNKKLYKVPTFGKIYKIIDFGRSIYQFNNTIFASDSFNKNEDADTQYNCEPFFDNTKKRIDNNYSFDLTRLACSLIDFFIDDTYCLNIMNEIEEKKKEPVLALIIDWLNDDNNKNVLYKSDGSTRYPGFKIYKMIARNVHNHTPEKEIESDIFKSYIVKDNKKAKQIMNKQVKKLINLQHFDEFYNKNNK